MVPGKAIRKMNDKREMQSRIMIMLLLSCVTLGRSVNFSEPESFCVKWKWL